MARCDTYDFGECTWGACQLLGWVPEGLGNADEWLGHAAARGLATTGTPTVGSVVVYGASRSYSDFGHCGEVIAVYDRSHFRVREMNFTAFDAYDDRDSTLFDVLGFILPPGVAPGSPGTNPPPPAPGGVVGLELGWASLADFWNRVIEEEVGNLRWLQGYLHSQY